MSDAGARRAIPAHARESVWNAADGHSVRRIDWAPPPIPPRGSLLFVAGRGDFYEKYLETLDYWHGQGWRVTALDWRGQAGSGRLGTDAVTGHIGDFSIWVNDLARFWGEWSTANPGPRVLAGHSMGGHLALRATAEGRVRPDGLLLSAPMLGFRDGGPSLWLARIVARVMCTVRDPRRPAWKWSEKPGETPADRAGLLTHDQQRYADELWWRDQRPELVMGPGSWGWVERALESMRGLFAPGMLEGVTQPVLLLSAPQDALVSRNAIRRAAARLPTAELVEFPGASHELLRESDIFRDQVLARTDTFLGRVAAGDEP